MESVFQVTFLDGHYILSMSKVKIKAPDQAKQIQRGIQIQPVNRLSPTASTHTSTLQADLMTMTCSFTCAFESNHPAPAMQFPRQLHDGDRPNRTCQPRHVVEEQRFFYGRCRLVTTFLIHDEMEIWRCGRSIPYKMCEFVILLAFASPCIVRSIGSIQFM